MTNDYRIEMARIDLEARRMRAETLRGLFAGVSAHLLKPAHDAADQYHQHS